MIGKALSPFTGLHLFADCSLPRAACAAALLLHVYPHVPLSAQ